MNFKKQVMLDVVAHDLIPAQWRQKQVDFCDFQTSEFQASQSSIVRDPVSKSKLRNP